MKSITDLFIKRPVLAIVVNLIILVVGLRAVTGLPVSQYPRLESSSLVITTVYIGANAETMRGFVTTPIERAVSAIDGVDYIESASTPGVSKITVWLRLNHDSNNALAEVNARLSQVRAEIPAEAEPSTIEITRADRPFASFYLSFTSTSMSRTQLTDYLSRVVQAEFGTLPGVQRAGVDGGRQLAMRIWLDPGRMSSLSVSPEEVQSALRRNNYLAAVGRTKGGAVQVDLLADTDLRTEAEFRDLIVRQSDGAIIRLSDIATIELGSEEPMESAKMNQTDAVWVSVWPLPNANEISVSGEVRKTMEKLRPNLPGGVTMTLAFDATTYISSSIKEISKTLAETVLIVALVVFLFMGSIRTALVPLIAMPISLIGAVAMMQFMGFSLNLLTILAIVLAVGLVVDDAIVVVENVERHVRMGKPRVEAALVAARELTGPIISMTITLAAVYAPIGLQAGLTGMLFREFAFTLAAAVVVSGVVAITLSPLMSSRLVNENGREGWLTRQVSKVFDKVRAGYAVVLDWTLSLRWTVALAALAVIGLAVPLYTQSRSELAPVEDQGMVILAVDSAPDASLAYTTKYGEQLSAAMNGIKESDFVWQLNYTTSGFGGLMLKDWSERDRTAEQIQSEAFGLAAQVPGVRVYPVLPKPLPGAGTFDVELVVSSTDEAEVMLPIGFQLVGRAMESGKFMFADTDLKIDMPQARVIIDRTKIADLGLDLAKAGGELAVLLAGGYTNRFNHEGRSYKVIPQIGQSDRNGPMQLLDLRVAGRNGEMIPVSTFARIESATGPRTLNRFQQQNSMKITGGAAPGVTKAQALDALEAIAREVLPPQYKIDFSGESRQIRNEGGALAVTLGFAIILIYLVLAAQFGSFRDPFIVLLGSVPLALSGALVFTYLDFTTINIYTQVGLITLVGLVAKNGILIVEFANTLQTSGLDRTQAVREACLTRLRPILMTSAATVFGHMPLVFVTGAGAAARNSIGIVLVTGMVIGTFFTLFVVPALYTLIAQRRAAQPQNGAATHDGAASTVAARGVHAATPAMANA